MRVNRALRATHSRRESNRFIADGRLTVNGKTILNPDTRLTEGDIVHFDGAPVVWAEDELGPHRHIKYHKPAGVVSTTKGRRNMMDALSAAGCQDNDDVSSPRRVYPIGRLDAESTGLMLLTSDGSIVNALLRGAEGKRKIYHVTTAPRASDAAIRQLGAGVVITTVAQREGVPTNVTAPTRPCEVTRLEGHVDDSCGRLQFVLEEGRNRQIRKMCAALELAVVCLHRVSFSGVDLTGCEEVGSWAPLSAEEELAIGARKPPTRSERRTPEERARRKAAGKRNR